MSTGTSCSRRWRGRFAVSVRAGWRWCVTRREEEGRGVDRVRQVHLAGVVRVGGIGARDLPAGCELEEYGDTVRDVDAAVGVRVGTTEAGWSAHGS